MGFKSRAFVLIMFSFDLDYTMGPGNTYVPNKSSVPFGQK